MRRVLAALLLVAGLVVAAWWGWRAAPPPLRTSPAPAPEDPSRELPLPELTDPALRIPGSPAEPGPPRCGVRGMVLAASGAPALECTVQLGSGADDPGALRELPVDAAGQFSVVDLEVVEPAEVRVFAPGHALQRLALVLWPGEITDVGTIVLALESRLNGRVIDAEENGVSGASVRAGGSSATSGPEGRFELVGLGSGWVECTASLAGHVERPLPPLWLDVGERRGGLRLILDREAFLEGVVEDERGRALAGAEVRGSWFDADEGALRDSFRAFRETVSDAVGAYRLGPFPQGLVQLLAQHPGFLPGQWMVRHDAGRVPLTLQPLEGARVVSGVVEGASGPLVLERSQAYWTAQPGQPDWKLLETRPGREAGPGVGRFEHVITPLSGSFQVVASGAFGAARSEVHSAARERLPSPLQLVVEPGAALRASMVDAAGRALAGVQLELMLEEWASGPGPALRWGPWRSDAAGRVHTPVLPAGRYSTRISRPGFEAASQPELTLPATGGVVDQRWVLQARGAVLGRVRFDPPGAHAGFLVRLEPVPASLSMAPRELSVSTDEFRFDAVVPGEYRLVLLGPEALVQLHRALQQARERGAPAAAVEQLEGLQRRFHQVASETHGIQAGALTQVELKLSSAAVFGQVRVQPGLERSATLWVGLDPRRPLAQAPVSESGAFRFTGLTEGDWLLWGRALPGQAELGFERIRLQTGEQRRVDPDLRSVTVRGRLVDAETGQPVQGAAELLYEPFPPPDPGAAPVPSSPFGAARQFLGRVESGVQGEFEFTKVPPTDLRLNAMAVGYLGVLGVPWIELEADAAGSRWVRLHRSARLTLHAPGGARGAASRHAFRLLAEGAEPPVREGPVGRTQILDDLEPGVYRLQVLRDGALVAEHSFVLVAGAGLDVDLGEAE